MTAAILAMRTTSAVLDRDIGAGADRDADLRGAPPAIVFTVPVARSKIAT